jgi:hypothetical protein
VNDSLSVRHGLEAEIVVPFYHDEDESGTDTEATEERIRVPLVTFMTISPYFMEVAIRANGPSSTKNTDASEAKSGQRQATKEQGQPTASNSEIIAPALFDLDTYEETDEVDYLSPIERLGIRRDEGNPAPDDWEKIVGSQA